MKNQSKKRVTITISAEADQMLGAIAARDMRSRGSVVEVLLRAAHGGTQDSAPSHTMRTQVCANAARSDTFVGAMLKLDEMCS